jgi:hypothetical protein
MSTRSRYQSASKGWFPRPTDTPGLRGTVVLDHASVMSREHAGPGIACQFDP